jgi:hypothetical protein
MKKRIYKLLKRSFLIFLALIAFVLFFIPMPALSSDVRFAKDLYWYRAEHSLGKFFLVSTTIKDPEKLPINLLADEKHS